MIPYWNGTNWSVERILYGTVDYNANTFTVTTNGRGYKRTGPSTGVGHAINIENGTWSANGVVVSVSMSGDHNLQTGMERYIKFTSGGAVPGGGGASYSNLDGVYKITRTGDQTFTITTTVALQETGQTLQIRPIVRLYA